MVGFLDVVCCPLRVGLLDVKEVVGVVVTGTFWSIDELVPWWD